MKIKVSSNVYMLGVIGMALRLLQSGGSIFTMVFLDSFMSEAMAVFRDNAAFGGMYGNLPGNFYQMAEGMMQGIFIFSLVVGFMFALAYALIYVILCARGRKRSMGIGLFVVYLVFSALGVLSSGGSFISSATQLAGTGAAGLGLANMGTNLLSFAGSALVGASCIMFLSEHSRAKEEQRVESLRSSFAAPCGHQPVYEAFGAAPANEPESKPVSEPVSEPPQEQVKICPACGRQQRYDCAYCTGCGKPLGEKPAKTQYI